MKKIKVLNIYKTSLPDSVGGVEVFMDGLSRNTSKQNVENTIFALTKKPAKEPIEFNEYRIIQAKENLYLASTSFSLFGIYKFYRLAKQADIIHYHFPNPFSDLLHFICRVKKPSIVTYHSDIIKQKVLLKIYSPVMYRFFKSVDYIIATSPNYLATSGLLQDFKEKVKVIPIGLNKSDYPELNTELKAKWAANLPPKFFLFIGVMRYYKGLHLLLEAIAGSDLQVVVAGVGGVEEDLKSQAKSLGLENIYFVGQVSDADKVALLDLCYAYVFPSHLRSEAFGISLLEAAMYGKAMISSEIGTGTSYINVNNETGLVVAPSSPQDLKKAMCYLIENPQQTQKFGEKAEQRYKQYFTSELQSNAYVNLYKSICEKRLTHA